MVVLHRGGRLEEASVSCYLSFGPQKLFPRLSFDQVIPLFTSFCCLPFSIFSHISPLQPIFALCVVSHSVGEAVVHLQLSFGGSSPPLPLSPFGFVKLLLPWWPRRAACRHLHDCSLCSLDVSPPLRYCQGTSVQWWAQVVLPRGALFYARLLSLIKLVRGLCVTAVTVLQYWDGEHSADANSNKCDLVCFSCLI